MPVLIAFDRQDLVDLRAGWAVNPSARAGHVEPPDACTAWALLSVIAFCQLSSRLVTQAPHVRE